MATIGVGAMDRSEVMDFIKNSPVGILTLIDGDKPYGIPLEHHFDGKGLYFHILPKESRKLNCIKSNPNACFVIYESRRERPDKDTPCRSVIIEGQVTINGSRLNMDIREIGNWKCPPSRFATCDAGQ